MKVQRDASAAAISNLSDLFESRKKTYCADEEQLTEHQSRHKLLLDNFDSNIDRLGRIPLLPALRSYGSPPPPSPADWEGPSPGPAAPSSAPSASVADSAFLVDLLQVPAERQYKERAQQSHEKVFSVRRELRQLLVDLEAALGRLATADARAPSGEAEEAAGDRLHE